MTDDDKQHEYVPPTGAAISQALFDHISGRGDPCATEAERIAELEAEREVMLSESARINLVLEKLAFDYNRATTEARARDRALDAMASAQSLLQREIDVKTKIGHNQEMELEKLNDELTFLSSIAHYEPEPGLSLLRPTATPIALKLQAHILRLWRLIQTAEARASDTRLEVCGDERDAAVQAALDLRSRAEAAEAGREVLIAKIGSMANERDMFAAKVNQDMSELLAATAEMVRAISDLPRR